MEQNTINQEILTESGLKILLFQKGDDEKLNEFLIRNIEDKNSISKPQLFRDYGIWLEEKLIGIILLIPIDRGVYEIEYLIDKEYRGKGFGKESIRTLINSKFKNTRTMLRAMTKKDNDRSQKMLIDLGFELEEDLRNFYTFVKRA